MFKFYYVGPYNNSNDKNPTYGGDYALKKGDECYLLGCRYQGDTASVTTLESTPYSEKWKEITQCNVPDVILAHASKHFDTLLIKDHYVKAIKWEKNQIVEHSPQAEFRKYELYTFTQVTLMLIGYEFPPLDISVSSDDYYVMTVDTYPCSCSHLLTKVVNPPDYKHITFVPWSETTWGSKTKYNDWQKEERLKSLVAGKEADEENILQAAAGINANI